VGIMAPTRSSSQRLPDKTAAAVARRAKMTDAIRSALAVVLRPSIVNATAPKPRLNSWSLTSTDS